MIWLDYDISPADMPGVVKLPGAARQQVGATKEAKERHDEQAFEKSAQGAQHLSETTQPCSISGLRGAF